MKVKLIGHTEHHEIVCAKAAWLCTHSEPCENMTYSKACALVERVLGYGHYSIAEAASFSVLVEDVSIVLTHQLVRHRIASYCQKSFRYNKLEGDSQIEYYVTPNTLTNNDTFARSMTYALQSYQSLLDQGVPQEDARYCLPVGMKTNIQITMNARAWREFLSKRLCLKAQWEIRTMAEEIHRLLSREAKALFVGVGADCKNCQEKEKCK